jgi:hypothetical protein
MSKQTSTTTPHPAIDRESVDAAKANMSVPAASPELTLLQTQMNEMRAMLLNIARQAAPAPAAPEPAPGKRTRKASAAPAPAEHTLAAQLTPYTAPTGPHALPVNTAAIQSPADAPPSVRDKAADLVGRLHLAAATPLGQYPNSGGSMVNAYVGISNAPSSDPMGARYRGNIVAAIGGKVESHDMQWWVNMSAIAPMVVQFIQRYDTQIKAIAATKAR